MPTNQLSKYHLPLNVKLFLNPSVKVSEHAALYITNTLRVFSIALVGIFLPIYIYKISFNFPFFYEDQFANGVTFVLFYFLLRSIGVITSILTMTKLIFNKLGFGKSILLSQFVLIGEIVLWIMAENSPYLILPAGFLAGVITATYWIPYHLFFVEKMKETTSHYGMSTAILAFLTNLASALAPALGGLIITLFDFRTLFLLIIFLVILSGLTVLANVQDWIHGDHNPVEIIKSYVFNGKYKLLTFAFFGEGIEIGIFTVLWPIALFLGLSGFVEIGFLNAISMTLSALATLLVGKILDKSGYKVIHFIGNLINSVLYFCRIFFTTPVALYAIDIADRVNTPLYGLPNTTIAYDKAQRLGRANLIIYRELSIHIGLVLGVLLALIVLPFAGSNWRYLFLIPAFGVFLNFLLDRDMN